MYCRSCGYHLSEQANYCSRCGVYIKNQTNFTQLDAIVSRLKKGDNTAFDEFYMQTQSYVRYVANQFFVNEKEKTEDVVQEVYLTVFRKIDMLDDPSAAWGWIKTITRNISLNYIEKEKRYLLLDEDEEFIFNQMENTDVHLIPEAVVDEKAQKEILGSMIDELPVLQKMILMEHYYNDKKISEIAEAYELVEGTVKSSLSRARKNLAEKLLAYQKRTGVCVYSVPSASLIYLVFREEIQKTIVTTEMPIRITELLCLNGIKSTVDVMEADNLINYSVSVFDNLKSKAKDVINHLLFAKSTTAKVVLGIGTGAAIATGVAQLDIGSKNAETEIINLVECFEVACQNLNQEMAVECMSTDSANALIHIDLMKEYVRNSQLSIENQKKFDLQVHNVEVDEDRARAYCHYVRKNSENREEIQEGYLGFVHEGGEWKIDLCRANRKMYQSGKQGKNVRFPELIYYELVYNDELEK